MVLTTLKTSFYPEIILLLIQTKGFLKSLAFALLIHQLKLALQAVANRYFTVTVFYRVFGFFY